MSKKKEKKIVEPLSKAALLMLAVGFVAFTLSSGRFNIWIMAWIWPFAFFIFFKTDKI